MKKMHVLIICTTVLFLVIGCGQRKLKIGAESDIMLGTVFDVTMEII